VLEVKNLVKSFASLRAVDDISFTIKRGSCFGLLGPNGAGKTTTVEMLEGLQQPTSGVVLYKGNPLSSRFSEEAGIMFQSTALQDFMTVREALNMFSSFYTRTTDIATLVEQCALSEFLDRDTRKLSGGQKQRLLLAIALVNDPNVLFLDEPTTGLDPQARRNFWQLLNTIKQQGKTIVLTTHYMEEASLLCDELVFVDHGKIIAQGSPATLLEKQFDDVVLQLPVSSFRSGLDMLANAPAVLSYKQHKQQVEILTNNVNDCAAWLLAAEVSLSQLQVRSRNLEDLFLELTGQALRS